MTFMRPRFERAGTTLYRYTDGGIHMPTTHPCQLVLLYVPGSAGSYRQCRSIGAELLRAAHERQVYASVFCVDTRESYSAFDGDILLESAGFVGHAIEYITHLYASQSSPPALIIIGHSMGGVAALEALRSNAKTSRDAKGSAHMTVHAVVLLSVPLRRPPLECTASLRQVYHRLRAFWIDACCEGDGEGALRHMPAVASLWGGCRDWQVTAGLSATEGTLSPSLVAVDTCTATLHDVRAACDHLSIVWCNQLARAIASASVELALLPVDQPPSDAHKSHNHHGKHTWYGAAEPSITAPPITERIHALRAQLSVQKQPSFAHKQQCLPAFTPTAALPSYSAFVALLGWRWMLQPLHPMVGGTRVIIVLAVWPQAPQAPWPFLTASAVGLTAVLAASTPSELQEPPDSLTSGLLALTASLLSISLGALALCAWRRVTLHARSALASLGLTSVRMGWRMAAHEVLLVVAAVIALLTHPALGALLAAAASCALGTDAKLPAASELESAPASARMHQVGETVVGAWASTFVLPHVLLRVRGIAANNDRVVDSALLMAVMALALVPGAAAWVRHGGAWGGPAVTYSRDARCALAVVWMMMPLLLPVRASSGDAAHVQLRPLRSWAVVSRMDRDATIMLLAAAVALGGEYLPSLFLLVDPMVETDVIVGAAASGIILLAAVDVAGERTRMRAKGLRDARHDIGRVFAIACADEADDCDSRTLCTPPSRPSSGPRSGSDR